MKNTLTSSMVMFYFLVGLVPCYLVCHLLPTYVYRSFPSAPPVPPTVRIPCLVGGFLPLFLLPPPPPFPWTISTADARRCLLISASASCHLTMNRSAASRIPRYHYTACRIRKTYVSHSRLHYHKYSGSTPALKSLLVSMFSVILLLP